MCASAGRPWGISALTGEVLKPSPLASPSWNAAGLTRPRWISFRGTATPTIRMHSSAVPGPCGACSTRMASEDGEPSERMELSAEQRLAADDAGRAAPHSGGSIAGGARRGRPSVPPCCRSFRMPRWMSPTITRPTPGFRAVQPVRCAEKVFLWIESVQDARGYAAAASGAGSRSQRRSRWCGS